MSLYLPLNLQRVWNLSSNKGISVQHIIMAERPTHWYNETWALWNVWERWDGRKDRGSVCGCCCPATVASANVAVVEVSGCGHHTTAWWMVRRAEEASVPKNLIATHCRRTSNSSREAYDPALASSSMAVPATLRDKKAAMQAKWALLISILHIPPQDWGNLDTVETTTTLVKKPVIPITTAITPTTSALEV